MASAPPPPAYGATTQDGQQPPYPPAGAAQPPYPPTMAPQPGQPEPPTAPYYNEPPPKYEPPKDQEGNYPPPPPPGQQYPPQTQQPQGYQGATVYPGQPTGYSGQSTVHQTVIISQPGFGPLPRTMECPNCHATVTTSLTYQSGGLTWLSAGLMCLFGCWMGCCLIPFCIEDLQDVDHRCPNCGKHVGAYHRL